MPTKMEYLCMFCSKGEDLVKFTSRAEWLAHMDKHKKGGLEVIGKPKEDNVEMPPPPKEEQLPPKPIRLKYLYEGECDVCHIPVDTIEVELYNQYIVIAYCSRDKKTIIQTPVISIKEQLEKNDFSKGGNSLEQGTRMESRSKKENREKS